MNNVLAAITATELDGAATGHERFCSKTKKEMKLTKTFASLKKESTSGSSLQAVKESAALRPSFFQRPIKRFTVTLRLILNHEAAF